MILYNDLLEGIEKPSGTLFSNSSTVHCYSFSALVKSTIKDSLPCVGFKPTDVLGGQKEMLTRTGGPN